MAVTFATTQVGRMKIIAATMVSDGSGDAAGTVDVGALRVNRIVVDHDATPAQPTNAWDLTITDVDSIDILGAGGSNLAVATNVALQPKLDATPVVAEGGYMLVNGNLTFTGANMGDTKTAIVKVYGEVVR